MLNAKLVNAACIVFLIQAGLQLIAFLAVVAMVLLGASQM